VLAGVVSRFEPEKMRQGGSLTELVVSDYLAYYREKQEPARRLALLFLPRLIHNPCLHATVLLRLALRAPRLTLGIWRTLLIAKHSMDIQPDIEIGPGLVLPHPIGVLLGWGVRIGSGVTILHNVSIGGDPKQSRDATQMCPVIEDDVVIYTQSILIGPITVGKGAVIGARSWVETDVAPGQVHTRLSSPSESG
jgi:serine O-acetyltransferase